MAGGLPTAPPGSLHGAAGGFARRLISPRSYAQCGRAWLKRAFYDRWEITRIGSMWNGMSIFTDMSKSIASIMSQNRILDAVSGRANDKRYLAYLGIDGDLDGRIGREFAEHGEVIDGVRVANTERWGRRQRGARLSGGPLKRGG